MDGFFKKQTHNKTFCRAKQKPHHKKMKVLGFLFSLFVTLAGATHRQDCSDATDVNNFFINACREKCICTASGVSQYHYVCHRERPEFTCMASTDRQLFLDTFKTLSTPGNPQYTAYQSLVQRHGSGFGSIHTTTNFLPWHRMYIEEIEDLLRNIDCRVTVPWWRWSKKSNNPFVGSPFLNSPTWLGTDGQPTCVIDGPFASPGWSRPVGGGCLQRNFGGTFPSVAQIAATMNIPSANYNAFSDSLEVSIHNLPHVRIGGTMVTTLSPEAPEFFLHHAYIDQLWNAWQKKSNGHLNAYSFPLGNAMPWAWGVTPGDVNDLHASRIRYVNVRSSTSGAGHFSFLPACMLVKLPFATLSVATLEEALFNSTTAILARAARVPQMGFQLPTRQEETAWAQGARRAGASRKELEEMRRKFSLNRATVDRQNKILNIVDDFPDEASKDYGIDLPQLAETLDLMPDVNSCSEEGEEFDDRLKKCVPVSCEAASACKTCEICQPIQVTCAQTPCPQFECKCRY